MVHGVLRALQMYEKLCPCEFVILIEIRCFQVYEGMQRNSKRANDYWRLPLLDHTGVRQVVKA